METPYEAMKRRWQAIDEEMANCYDIVTQCNRIKDDSWTIIPIPKGSNRCPLYHCPLSLTPVSSWHPEKEEK
jgi:hypothetical protein